MESTKTLRTSGSRYVGFIIAAPEERRQDKPIGTPLRNKVVKKE